MRDFTLSCLAAIERGCEPLFRETAHTAAIEIDIEAIMPCGIEANADAPSIALRVVGLSSLQLVVFKLKLVGLFVRLFVCLLVCLFACLVGCLLVWLVGWLVGWLIGRSVGWFDVVGTVSLA